ncbi:methyl-accepting chemotaxis protein [Altererythrobacter sp. GH1-8]|uniref:methyl-accepting chemotaxis protein n=1 Tax=Altererythrobacter sp. GH1-8 TaxID=3349333 RepID=UPI00374DAAFC
MQIWLAVAIVLVTGMQIGFLFLEAGLVRSKNSINVALKNIADLALALLAYSFFGAAIMFASGGSLIGFDLTYVGYDDQSEVIMFLMLQALFCGTAATIVSGAVAERTQFTSYLILTLPLTALIYPIIGHWTWASLLPGGENRPGWLEAIGFIDHAGSSIVHMTGGVAALAVLMVIGPRMKRFDPDGGVRPVQGHNPVLAGAGALMLLVGWLGFNSGGLTPGSDEFARAIANTLLAGAGGCLAACIAGHLNEGYFRVDRLINGLLVGLVAITASAPVASAISASLLGLVAGAASVHVANYLERNLKIDDAVYAVAVHGFGGVIGTLAVPLVLRPGIGTLGIFEQFAVQALGVVVIGGFTFASMYAMAYLMHQRGKLRVSREVEEHGLNFAEHGATLGSLALARMLEDINRGQADLSSRFEFEPMEEGSEIAEALNTFLASVESAERAADAELKKLIVEERDRADRTEHLMRQFQADFAAMVAELKAHSNALAQGSITLSEQSQTSGGLVEQVRDQAGQTVRIAEQMSEGARQLATALEAVGAKVAQANRASERAGEASRKGAEIASTLESSTGAIGKLVAMIQNISDQTKLLSLNAKIEAVRAGDAGKGFTAVSAEVNQLAQQTEAASDEIGRIVESLQTLIGSSIAQFRAIDKDIDFVRCVAADAQDSAQAQRQTSSELARLIGAAKEQALGNGVAVSKVTDNFKRSLETIGAIDGSAQGLEGLAMRIDGEVQALTARITETSGRE